MPERAFLRARRIDSILPVWPGREAGQIKLLHARLRGMTNATALEGKALSQRFRHSHASWNPVDILDSGAMSLRDTPGMTWLFSLEKWRSSPWTDERCEHEQ
jgi:hypothetical protein